MKTSLEYKGNPVLTEKGFLPARGSLLTICAWCDPEKTLAQKLERAGYKLSHGICDKHREEWAKKMNHTN